MRLVSSDTESTRNTVTAHAYRHLHPMQQQTLTYSVIQKDSLNFVHLYFLNYTWYVNDLHNI